MVSRVDICNLALIESKSDETIESLDEASIAAERCKRLYDVCRRELLSNYPWTFAVKFEELARVSDVDNGSKYSYVYPEECLRIIHVYKSKEDYKNKNFRVDGPNNQRVVILEKQKILMSDEETPFAEYIIDEQIEDNFSPMFVHLLSLEIGLRLAKLSGMDKDELKLLMAQVQQAEQAARVNSVSEDDNHLNIDDETYINVRG